MAKVVCSGATCLCTFGTGPGTLTGTNAATIKMKGQPVVTIADCAPTNLTPFAMCTSLANPAVASATAAALGVLTPQPCTLSITGQWIPKTPTVKMGGKPVLTQDCTLMCAYGGQISIQSPGQVTISAG